MSDGEISVEPLAQQHREALRAACAEDAAIWQIYPVSFAGEAFNDAFEACLGQAGQAGFAILSGNQLVGMSIYLGIDRANRLLEIGRTYIAPHVRGTGLNGRVKRLMLIRAFAEGFKRVEFRIDTGNGRSMAALEKLGAVREGTLRRNRVTWTGFTRDTALYSMLADEWRDPSLG